VGDRPIAGASLRTGTQIGNISFAGLVVGHGGGTGTTVPILSVMPLSRETEQRRARLVSLFSDDEIDSLLAVVESGRDRDSALSLLIDNAWCAELALERAVQQPEPEASTDAPERATCSSTSETPTAPSLDAGYVVLRAPEHNSHMRGRHRCSWGQLMTRLKVERALWPQYKKGYYIRLYEGESKAEALWLAQRLVLPIPVDPQ